MVFGSSLAGRKEEPGPTSYHTVIELISTSDDTAQVRVSGTLTGSAPVLVTVSNPLEDGPAEIAERVNERLEREHQPSFDRVLQLLSEGTRKRPRVDLEKDVSAKNEDDGRRSADAAQPAEEEEDSAQDDEEEEAADDDDDDDNDNDDDAEDAAYDCALAGDFAPAPSSCRAAATPSPPAARTVRARVADIFEGDAHFQLSVCVKPLLLRLSRAG
jgi:hypothetical protein